MGFRIRWFFARNAWWLTVLLIASPVAGVAALAGSGRPAAQLAGGPISGVQLRDYWFYVHGRWVFDLVLSNPSSVRLHKMTPQQYAAALGCAQ